MKPKLKDYGGVAQMVRASGSYPLCHPFDPDRRHHPVTQKKEEAAYEYATIVEQPFKIKGCFLLLRREG